MNWLKKLFGFETKVEKLRRQMLAEKKKSFEFQRKGDMRSAGRHERKAEELAGKIAALDFENDGRND